MRLVAGMCPSLTQDVLSKLETQGIKNIKDLLLRNCEELAKNASVSYRDLRSIRRVIIAHHSAFAVRGDELLQEAINTTRVLSSGNTDLDSLLGGGLATGEVVEVCGGWGSGKTSLCVQLAVHAALELGLNVLYIDPLASLTPLRLTPVLEALSHDLELVDQALSRIKVTGPLDVWGVFRALNIPNQPYVPVRRGGAGPGDAQGSSANIALGKIKLVIVDSLSSVVIPLLQGNSRQGMAILNQLSVSLKSMAVQQQVAVVVVNSVVQGYTHGRWHRSFRHPKWKPALGSILLGSGSQSLTPGCTSRGPKTHLSQKEQATRVMRPPSPSWTSM